MRSAPTGNRLLCLNMVPDNSSQTFKSAGIRRCCASRATNGRWTNRRFVEALSYDYDAATDAAMERITCRMAHPFVLVVR